jgi:hypothetical protein
MITKFLLNNKYNIVESEEHKGDTYISNITKIKDVFTFKNTNNNKIQLIVVNETNLEKYIHDHFDLSPCMTWWDSIKNQFKSIFPEHTLRHKMLIINTQFSNKVIERLQQRLNKYKERGFIEMELPPNFLESYDYRFDTDLPEFKDFQVFDVITYEDISAKDILNKSYWNIIIHVGESYYSFHRYELTKYMEEHTSLFPNPLGRVYDTPFHQSLNKECLESLSYADYSIYHFVKDYDIQYRSYNKTMYSVKCYTVSDWIKDVKTPSMCIYPPKKELIHLSVGPIIHYENNVPQEIIELAQLLMNDRDDDNLPELIPDDDDEDDLPELIRENDLPPLENLLQLDELVQQGMIDPEIVIQQMELFEQLNQH